jgi:hypothetical protein
MFNLQNLQDKLPSVTSKTICAGLYRPQMWQPFKLFSSGQMSEMRKAFSVNLKHR